MSQTRVLFTSGAVAHYNGVNEEQMYPSEGGGGVAKGARCGLSGVSLHGGLSRDSQIPLSVQPKQPSLHVLISTQQVLLANTENCLPQ